MLNQMCHEVLSNADVNAIRKARGFTKSETDSRSQFESFYLSSIGLEAAMRSTFAGRNCLPAPARPQNRRSGSHLFRADLWQRPERDNRYYHGTFTQQYQEYVQGCQTKPAAPRSAGDGRTAHAGRQHQNGTLALPLSARICALPAAADLRTPLLSTFPAMTAAPSSNARKCWKPWIPLPQRLSGKTGSKVLSLAGILPWAGSLLASNACSNGSNQPGNPP